MWIRDHTGNSDSVQAFKGVPSNVGDFFKLGEGGDILIKNQD